MRTVLAISTAWLAATLVAVVVAAAAVGNVRTQVTDGPTALGPPTTIEADEEPPLPPSVSETPELSLDVDPPDDSIELVPETTTTSTTIVETTTSKASSSESPVTTTTTAPPTTTTTTTVASYTKTYNVTVDGVTAGTVRIAVSGETVSFSGATVAPGWKFELDEEGPEKVQVKFEAIEDDDIKFKFKAEIDDGELEVEISDDD